MLVAEHHQGGASSSGSRALRPNALRGDISIVEIDHSGSLWLLLVARDLTPRRGKWRASSRSSRSKKELTSAATTGGSNRPKARRGPQIPKLPSRSWPHAPGLEPLPAGADAHRRRRRMSLDSAGGFGPGNSSVAGAGGASLSRICRNRRIRGDN